MRRPLPPLNALRSFEAAARHASFTRAAEELHVTHGAISRQVKSLEDWYRQPLFSRVKGRIKLNAAGQRLFQTVEKILGELEETSRHLLQQGTGEGLSINVTSAFAALWLMPRLSEFQAEHPDLTLSLSPSRKFNPQGFAEGLFDLAIRWDAPPMAGLGADPLIEVDTFAACAPGLLAGKGIEDPSGLQAQMLIHDDDGEAWRALFRAAGLTAPDFSRGRFYSDSQLALQAAVDGQGVIAAGSVLAARALIDGRLSVPFGPVIKARHVYCLYYPLHHEKTEKVAAFRRWLSGTVARYQLERQTVENLLQTE
ncbi:LysR substrate-binding domain-containing protein [Aestuariispira insulae]|uniref:LysR family glycine cleavage system transcriptional activator n=1 Tax=Aestuariispira insulae TaxID=1461337 RepID=A0A3D9HIA1_9PROT|nr:LysR substrate-binding domain-containing protein [Aestuariispira insulae]RED49164.1 LysR family glycine cleavage system transcriptional activator [Aestuariispira insulae]